jgi:hypothetical protein
MYGVTVELGGSFSSMGDGWSAKVWVWCTPDTPQEERVRRAKEILINAIKESE